jgi:hypothetical protein|tara:strand:- start:258 stop:386 length:129 start_codon:yes stop_codon:yes gene_type:complete
MLDFGKIKEGTTKNCTILEGFFKKKHIQLKQLYITGCASIKK